MEGESFVIDPTTAKEVSWRREATDSETVLCLEWTQIVVQEGKEWYGQENKGVVDVQVTVTLRAGDPLSYWRINVVNRSLTYGIAREKFPLLSLAPIGNTEENVLLLPRSRSDLVQNPFTQRNTSGGYPIHFNMQFYALYNKQNGNGLYCGTQDSAPSVREIEFQHSSSEIS